VSIIAGMIMMAVPGRLPSRSPRPGKPGLAACTVGARAGVQILVKIQCPNNDIENIKILNLI
jgi:hypothetical protein